jgi:hypothetical protein
LTNKVLRSKRPYLADAVSDAEEVFANQRSRIPDFSMFSRKEYGTWLFQGNACG